jgi:cytoskeletal protein CcmA (bactofilin family)
MKVGESCECKEFEISGSATVGTSLKVGRLVVSGKIEADFIDAGRIDVRGKIASREIRALEVNVERDSIINGTVVCGSIRIEKGGKVEEVFADFVNVEKYADCGILECNEINVERHAEIEEVRYVRSAEISPASEVGKIIVIEKVSRESPKDVPNYFSS